MTQKPRYLQDLPPEVLRKAAQAVLERMRLEQQARADFAQSARFEQMLAALRDNPNPLAFTEEDLAYYREETLARLGWSDATEQELRHFVDVVAYPDAPGVQELTSDKECPFGNCSFVHYGLHVRMLFGQGTAVFVCNQAFWDSED